MTKTKSRREQAFELFLSSNGKIRNKELCAALSVKPSTVSTWKKEDEWLSRLNGKPKKAREPSKKIKNKNSEKFGFFQKTCQKRR